MIKGKTSSGFEYEVDERIIKDWRFAKALAKLSGEPLDKMSATIDIASMLLNNGQEESLMKHVEMDGFVDSGKMEHEIVEIINGLKQDNEEIKN